MKYFLPILTFSILLLPVVTLAQTPQVFMPLANIPGIDSVNQDFDQYINTLYAIAISIAALLAVIKIIIAGVKWMLTDVVTTKGEAKKDIQGAVLGLILILGAVLIINVINPNITSVNLQLKSLNLNTTLNTLPASATVPGTLVIPCALTTGNSGPCTNSDTCPSTGTYLRSTSGTTMTCVPQPSTPGTTGSTPVGAPLTITNPYTLNCGYDRTCATQTCTNTAHVVSGPTITSNFTWEITCTP